MKCKKCEWIESLGKPQSNREYWIFTEIFVKLHNGRDYCNKTEFIEWLHHLSIVLRFFLTKKRDESQYQFSKYIVKDKFLKRNAIKDVANDTEDLPF